MPYFRHCCRIASDGYNIQNEDRYDILHCITEHFIPRPNRLSKYQPRLVFTVAEEGMMARITKQFFVRTNEVPGTALVYLKSQERGKSTYTRLSMYLEGVYVGLETKLLEAKQCIDSALLEGGDEVCLEQLPELERIFQVRLMVYHSTMLVVDETEPVTKGTGRGELVNKDRYDLSPTDVLYTSSEDNDRPLIVLYVLHTDEYDSRLFAITETRNASTNTRNDHGIASHYFYVPQYNWHKLQSKSDIYDARVCSNCCCIIRSEVDASGMQVSAWERYNNHVNKC